MSDQAILNRSKYASFEDMALAWLGDWTSVLSDEQAYDVASACEAKQQAGDERDYCDIVQETMTEMELAS